MSFFLKSRLNPLLDDQDRTVKLGKVEREEALAPTELADFLSLMELRAGRN